jgi:hypothetical protein
MKRKQILEHGASLKVLPTVLGAGRGGVKEGRQAPPSS